MYFHLLHSSLFFWILTSFLSSSMPITYAHPFQRRRSREHAPPHNKRLNLIPHQSLAATNSNSNMTDISSISSSSNDDDGATRNAASNSPRPVDPWFREILMGSGVNMKATGYREPYSLYSEVQTVWNRVMIEVAERVCKRRRISFFFLNRFLFLLFLAVVLKQPFSNFLSR